MDKQFDYRGCKITVHGNMKHTPYQGAYYSVHSYTIIYPDGKVEELRETNNFASFLSVELHVDNMLKNKNYGMGSSRRER